MKQLIRLLTVSLLGVALVLIISFKDSQSPLSIEKGIAKHVVSFNVLILGNRRLATGFYLKYKDSTYIVTNKHVCDLHRMVYGHNNIQFEDYVGKIIKIDTTHDLCLVTSNRNDGLTLASEEAEPMDELILVGHPRGMGKTIRRGHYVSMEKMLCPWIGPGKFDAIQISTIAYGGNSGSPVTNTKGEVVGVLFAGYKGIHTETYIVPLSYLEVFLNLYAE